MLLCVALWYSVLQCVAVCCSVLQRVALCCSVLQCVAVCCSVLQCVAVRCNVLKFFVGKADGIHCELQKSCLEECQKSCLSCEFSNMLQCGAVLGLVLQRSIGCDEAKVMSDIFTRLYTCMCSYVYIHIRLMLQRSVGCDEAEVMSHIQMWQGRVTRCMGSHHTLYV